MQVLHDRFQNDPAVTVLAVHCDKPSDYLAKNGYTFPSIPDGRKVAGLFGVKLLPTFVVVGPDGTILHTHLGTLTDDARDEIAGIARGG